MNGETLAKSMQKRRMAGWAGLLAAALVGTNAKVLATPAGWRPRASRAGRIFGESAGSLIAAYSPSTSRINTQKPPADSFSTHAPRNVDLPAPVVPTARV